MEVRTVKETCPRCPSEEHPLLLPHQLAALRAMLDTERGCCELAVGEDEAVSTRQGVFGDKPGSGKSYVISELLLNCGAEHIPAADPIRRTLSNHVSVTVRGEENVRRIGVNLLVVPHNLAQQWAGILALFVSDAATTPSPYMIASKITDLPRACDVLHHEGGSPVRLMVVSSTLWADVFSILRSNRIGVDRIVFDEADSLRFQSPSSSAYASVARFFWFVTASFQNLLTGDIACSRVTVNHSCGAVETSVSRRGPLSRSVYVRSFFSGISGAWGRFLARTIIVTDNAFIDSSFSLREPLSHTITCSAPLHARILTGIASQDIIQRLHAGDLDTALMYLRPDRTDSENNIISAALSHFEVELNNAKAELEFVERRHYANPAHAEIASERVRQRIAAQEQRIGNIKERIQGAKECLICYEEIQNKTVVPCCNNSYCLACISTWVTTHSPRCPLCKNVLHTSDFMVCCDRTVAETSDPYEVGGVTVDRNKPKEANLAALLKHLAAEPDRKILFFCDNEYAIDQYGKHAMRTAGIGYAPLKGNSVSIAKRVRDFNAGGGGTRALLVNCTHYGCGLDLSTATDVIIYHAVDTRMDAQIIGRAQRPPRSSRLNVWRFVNNTEPPPPSALPMPPLELVSGSPA
jgi:hypothetical protein